ncbi:hypothetical protein B0T20DRAFT_404676 [Sordaria brevicollis]|uniref:Uncharacterized protein n=1 Tax=Sordaria brevicollis TaxID=83679 RepID=A0AAE0PIF5_SORBR|nr:hypothetical protein B0T20DRAFT_404676 [Sordaria brevicollis]
MSLPAKPEPKYYSQRHNAPSRYYPAIINIDLTQRPLHKQKTVNWSGFWKALVYDSPEWRSRTSYDSGIPPSPGGNPNFERMPQANLSSLKSFIAKEDAEKETKATQEILRGLGFVDNPGRGTPNRAAEVGIWMIWGRPNRERLEIIMPRLVKAEPPVLCIGNWPIDVPDARWVDYIEWEKYTAHEAEEVDKEAEGQPGKEENGEDNGEGSV